jgi:nucleotide-binding universal stress UspA family protein
MFKNILVPTDGSAPSRKAIKRAVQLAREQRARVIGFYVGPPWQLPVYSEYVPPEVMSPKEHAAAVKKTAARYLGAVKKAAAASGVRCKCAYVMAAHPYDEIVKAARRYRCDVIVISSHPARYFQAATWQRNDQGARAQHCPGAGLPIKNPAARGGILY